MEDNDDRHPEEIEEDILQEGQDGVPNTVHTHDNSSIDYSSLGVLSVGERMQQQETTHEREGVTLMNDPRTHFGKIVKPPQHFEFLVETINEDKDDCDDVDHLSDIDPHSGCSHSVEFPKFSQQRRITLLTQAQETQREQCLPSDLPMIEPTEQLRYVQRMDHLHNKIDEDYDDAYDHMAILQQRRFCTKDGLRLFVRVVWPGGLGNGCLLAYCSWRTHTSSFVLPFASI